MEKRLLLAVVLMTAAIMFTNVLFPPAEPPVPVADQDVAPAAPPTAPSATPAASLPRAATGAGSAPADSVVVESDLYRYVFSTRGAALLQAQLLEYPSYSGDDEVVQLVPDGEDGFLHHQLLVGGDTLDLAGLGFEASGDMLRITADGGPQTVSFEYADPDGFGVVLRYTFRPDTYLISAVGSISGLGGRDARLLTSLGPRLEIHEHPDHNSENELAVVTRTSSGVDRLAFRRVEGRELVDSPLTWAGIKDKYFFAAVIAGDDRPFAGAVVRDVPDLVRTVGEDEVTVPQTMLTTILPVAADGQLAFDAFLGPQDYSRLSAIGYDLEEVTPYGYRWLQPIIRPLAAAVLWVLNTLHDTLGIAYGWVLAIFGVMMRVILWPLNAKALRAQMKNMGVQPLLQEIKEKHKNDPQKQQEAMLGLYKEHGFNPFAGCLPMLVPFPVLITLFFVFQNTIAFRGAEFLWLPDLSLRDPLYILPAILVVSMFGLQWVSAHMSGMEQNPQMKMMMYFMPIMMGAIFFMLPAGLNLYYAVTQVASIPQQVLIARERKRAQEELKKASAPPKSKKSKAKR
ncbi:MAG: membrane protein insertase YidC [Gemmatimonadota bacterium]